MSRRVIFFSIGMFALLASASGFEHSLNDQPSPEQTTAGQTPFQQAAATPDDAPAASVQELVRDSCLHCHSGTDAAGSLDLDPALTGLAANQATWERVLHKLQTRQMPPLDQPRPEESSYVAAIAALTPALDTMAAQHPHPGRSLTMRRLTRTEYGNAVRDLLGIEVDVETLLPADDLSHGFDNVTVGELSPTLVSRYLSAAQKISRLAVGRAQDSPDVTTFRVAADVTQEERVDGLPLGTRGGMLIPFNFPQDGDYEVEVRLARDRDEHVEGLNGEHELEILLDSSTVERFSVRPPSRRAADPADGEYNPTSHEDVDRHLKACFPVKAGPHEVGVAFIKKSSSLLETARQPLHVHYNMYRHPRLGPAVYQVTVVGPFNPADRGSSPSRERIFTVQPQSADEEDACARQIISYLLRLACRQPISDDDLTQPLELYRQARAEGDFESGIEMALAAILVHPKFLFRVEQDPPQAASGSAYEISDLELASRLSFFLWSSLPDDELLRLAERGELHHAQTLEQQVRRMLRDDKAGALVTNFASQWLHLRNLDSVTPDARLFPDFDDNLRQAFRQETELFVASVFAEDRSVIDLLHSDATFLNQRLAQHYGIPHVYGSQYRRVVLDDVSHRGGLLRQGSILSVTSYATRTSPVVRGKWILTNILGTPPPPPPDNVPNLPQNAVGATLSVRERLAVHRADAACASCHQLIDPVGFSLENYDAVGRWREFEEGKGVDASGSLPGGDSFDSVAGLEQELLAHPEIFVSALTDKLMTYALGRGVEPYDRAAIRQIVREARDEDYRFSSLILGIVNSTPFRMREAR